jgi:hypothetical protein
MDKFIMLTTYLSVRVRDIDHLKYEKGKVRVVTKDNKIFTTGRTVQELVDEINKLV